MEHDGAAVDCRPDGLGFPDVRLDEAYVRERSKIGAIAGIEIIEHDDFVAALEQVGDEVGADETGAASNQSFHRSHPIGRPEAARLYPLPACRRALVAASAARSTKLSLDDRE